MHFFWLNSSVQKLLHFLKASLQLQFFMKARTREKWCIQLGCLYTLNNITLYFGPIFVVCIIQYKYSYVPAINVSISEDKVNSLANNATTKMNASLVELRRLFLVENMLDSIKFGLCLWVLTYIGSWFNAMTLVLMTWVGLFTIPKVNWIHWIHNSRA